MAQRYWGCGYSNRGGQLPRSFTSFPQPSCDPAILALSLFLSGNEVKGDSGPEFSVLGNRRANPVMQGAFEQGREGRNVFRVQVFDDVGVAMLGSETHASCAWGRYRRTGSSPSLSHQLACVGMLQIFRFIRDVAQASKISADVIGSLRRAGDIEPGDQLLNSGFSQSPSASSEASSCPTKKRHRNPAFAPICTLAPHFS